MKIFRKISALFLCAFVVFGTVAVGIGGLADVLSLKASAAKLTDYKFGDIIEFGSYPQTEVKDANLISELNDIKCNWISYRYYAISEESDELSPSDFMRYKDVSFNGNKYRAVTFDTYRPEDTDDVTSRDNGLSYSSQPDNNFFCDEVYWFIFEPIKWIVVDSESGVLLSQVILDAQPYSAYYVWRVNDAYNESGCYANDWKSSSLRKWLNSDFYDVSFSESEKSNILENGDFVNLLSEKNSPSNNEMLFCAKASDYAYCQGIDAKRDTNTNCLYWWVDGQGEESLYACAFKFEFNSSNHYDVGNNGFGVRPVIILDTKSGMINDKINSISSTNKSDNMSNADDKYDVSSVNSENKLDYDPAEINENQVGLGTIKNGENKVNKSNILIAALIGLVVILIAVLVTILHKRPKQTDKANNFSVPEVFPVEPPYQLIPSGNYGVCQRCKNETDNIYVFRMKENGVEHSAQVCENCGKALAEVVNKRNK